MNQDGTVSIYGITALSGEGDPDSLVSITDQVSALTLPANEQFQTLATSSSTSLFRGVSLAPVPEPGTLALLAAGSLAGSGFLKRRRK